jgi:hypothetical protein
MRSIFLSLYLLHYNKIKIVVDAVVDSEHGKVIQCDFKPGSVKRSIDLDKEGMPQAASKYLHYRQPIKIEKFACSIYFGRKIYDSRI